MNLKLHSVIKSDIDIYILSCNPPPELWHVSPRSKDSFAICTTLLKLRQCPTRSKLFTWGITICTILKMTYVKLSSFFKLERYLMNAGQVRLY